MRTPTRLFACLLAAAAFLAAPAARAADADDDLPLLISSKDTGLTFSLRAAYAIPLGNYASGASFSDVYKGAIPLQLDVGYRLSPSFTVAAFFQYAFAFAASDTCPGGASCSGSDIRLGAEVLYRILPEAKWIPWVGLGAGYEWARASASAGGVSVDSTAKGWEFANFQVGADYQWGKSLSFGPFATFTLGQFSSVDVSGGSVTGSDIKNKAIHDWLQLGLKGTFNL